MNRFLKFVRATLVGGVLFLLPLIVVVIIVGKALAIARKFVTPLAAHLPGESVIGGLVYLTNAWTADVQGYLLDLSA